MARIRTIKPEFFTSEDVVSLSPLARLLYIALWCEADKEGRLIWKPRTFKMRYLPADSCDIESLCNELLTVGVVRLYGDGYAFIPSFTTHQHVNPRESASQLPEPNLDLTRRDASARVNSRIDPQGGREGKGKEGVKPPQPPSADAEGGAFDSFWEAWPDHPRKVAKDQCRAKWAKKGCEVIAGNVIAAVEAAKRSADWAKDGGAFIPAPLVWLKQSRWEAATESENAPDVIANAEARRTAEYLEAQERHRQAAIDPEAMARHRAALQGAKERALGLQ